MLTLETIYQAAHTLRRVAKKTDLIHAPALVKDCNLYLKAENLQITGSFKLRGAYFKMSTLTEEQKQKGVVACSAGNHAQGVALGARENNVQATIFVPSTAPISKVEATRSYGAKVVLVDGVYDDAFEAAVKFQKESGGVFIHPFDDEDVIVGQGTIGLEIIDQFPDVEAVVVPIGGGGIISGVAYAIKKLKPNCKIFGVQAMGAPSMSMSLEEHKRSNLEKVSTFADGIAVKKPGKLTFNYCSSYVDEVVTVTDDEIATAILTLIEEYKLVAEGAGAVSVAAAMFGKLPIKGLNTVCIVSGGNIDVNILSRVINRGLLTSGRLSDLNIQMLDKPGQLQKVSSIIAKYGANVIKVNHNPAGENSDINGCFLHLTMETKNYQHLEEIKNALISEGFTLA